MTKTPFQSAKPNPAMPNITDVTVDDVFANKNQVRIIDVRQPDEWTGELGHIAEASLMVLNTLPNELPKVSKDDVVVFVCRSGGRSAQATAFAKQNGYSNVYNMKGGMLEWNKCCLPITKND